MTAVCSISSKALPDSLLWASCQQPAFDSTAQTPDECDAEKLLMPHQAAGTLTPSQATQHVRCCSPGLLQDNMVVTNQRVLFLQRQWVWGLCFASHEEAFYLDDLHVG